MRILRTDEVAERLGVSRTTLWRWEREGDFPDRIKLGPNSVGWRESDLEDWLEQRADARPTT